MVVGKFCDTCGLFFTWTDPEDEGGLPPPKTCPECLRKKQVPVPDPFRSAFHDEEFEL